MGATHEVQVWNHKGSWRTRWYACEVVGKRRFADGKPGYDVRLRDGTVYEWCAPECVRVKG